MEEIDEIARKYISIAEDCFGAMCTDWRYVGTEINDMGPHLRYYPKDKEVSISLSEKVMDDEVQLHFQLSHEVCHLLYPTTCHETNKLQKTTMLNEGVSTYFSVLAMEQFGQTNFIIENLKEYSPSYYKALLLTSELFHLDENAVYKLRCIQAKLNEIQPEDFIKAGVTVPEELCKQLLSIFS